MGEEGDYITHFHLNLDALRLLHCVVSDAYERWPGGVVEEQELLYTMKTQLYAALMEYLLD